MNALVRIGVCVALCGALGCNALGPKTIRGGRLNYNEAIARSWDEQLLLNLVRLKYRDTPFFLEVDSVSTQYNLAYSAGASPTLIPTRGRTRQLAVSGAGASGSVAKSRGDADEYGFDVGVSFYERPTVTYSPLQGQKFVSQLLSPIPLEAILLLTQSGWSAERAFRMCVQRMNSLDNASSASGPTPDYAPRFEEFRRVAQVLRGLQIGQGLDAWVETTDSGTRLVARLAPEAARSPEVAEFRQLLGLPPDATEFVLTAGPRLEI